MRHRVRIAGARVGRKRRRCHVADRGLTANPSDRSPALRLAKISSCRSALSDPRPDPLGLAFAPANAALLAAVNRGEFVLGGLRNRDVRDLLYPKVPDGLTDRQLAGRVSRQLSLLRAHGLIARLGKSRRYKVTQKGRTIITAFLTAARADTEQLTKLAA